MAEGGVEVADAVDPLVNPDKALFAALSGDAPPRYPSGSES